MFLPENAAQGNTAEKERKAAFKKIEEWSLKLIPEPLRNDVTISVQEVQCGDPQCSPIDTAIAVVFDRYVRRILRGGITKSILMSALCHANKRLLSFFDKII